MTINNRTILGTFFSFFFPSLILINSGKLHNSLFFNTIIKIAYCYFTVIPLLFFLLFPCYYTVILLLFPLLFLGHYSTLLHAYLMKKLNLFHRNMNVGSSAFIIRAGYF